MAARKLDPRELSSFPDIQVCAAHIGLSLSLGYQNLRASRLGLDIVSFGRDSSCCSTTFVTFLLGFVFSTNWIASTVFPFLFIHTTQRHAHHIREHAPVDLIARQALGGTTILYWGRMHWRTCVPPFKSVIPIIQGGLSSN